MMTTARHEEDPLEPYAESVLTGESAAVRRLRTQIERLAPHYRSASIVGERGTGKLAVAREMHRRSAMADRPMAVYSAEEFCAGRDAPKDWAGTVVLRGLGSAPLDMQQRILARLGGLSRETRVLVLTASELRGTVASGRMLPDLYRRLGTLDVGVPALRERTDDLEALTQGMSRGQAQELRFDEAAMARLQAFGWPGNLRELWGFCVASAARGPVVTLKNLPAFQIEVRRESSAVKLEEVMMRHVKDVLERCAGNKLRAAELLGISRSTLYRMLGSAAG